jgi:hypothetical protein
LCNGAEKSAPFLFFTPIDRADRPALWRRRATTAHTASARMTAARCCHFGEPHSNPHADRAAGRKPIGSGPVRLTLKTS